ncbi:ATP-binding protein [Microbacterium sediminicola]|uniref:Sensor-like histidine kinase SenX3 n=1 Tax=Microbacterium sediminicola TaxID=415210 RepID=A0ABN2I4M5_9MICO
MTPAQFALLGLAVGVLIGVALTAVIFLALRERERREYGLGMDIPEGARVVLQGLDDPAIVLDAAGIVIAGSASAAMFGFEEGRLLPTHELRSVARRARESDVASKTTLRVRRGSAPGEIRLVTVRATALTQRLTLLVLRDITERERVEQMRRDFVSNTSHELKTPVGAVSLLAEAIESAADDPDQVRNFASRLSAEAHRLGTLTSRIMNLSRLQAADELNDERVVSVDEIVASAVEAHTVQAESAGVQLVRGGARGVHVRGDAQVLSEAVGNLIANAIAYSPKGSSVGIGIKPADEYVEIAVTDRGIGISEAEQERVFERFYRADQARSRRTGGTGLGLAIVKHAVQRHGGEVRLWSREGRGSTFTIVLPMVPSPTDDPPRKPARKKKLKKERASARSGAAASKNGDTE